MHLTDFLSLSAPEQFDFKSLMAHYYWRYAHKWLIGTCDPGDQNSVTFTAAYLRLLQTLQKMGTDDPIERWYLYRTLDEPILQKRVSRTGIKAFDCDSWNGTCDLTTDIYKTLWPQWIKAHFSGDTMHSFAYTFNAFSGMQDYGASYEHYKRDPVFRDDARRALGEYARRVSWLGNFTLVPKNYNRHRGRFSNIKDYWDLSLDNFIHSKDGKTWLVPADFKKYINAFFLWDYVSARDDTYEVKPLWEGHRPFLGSGAAASNADVLPDKDQVRQFTACANRSILRRGIFMAAMLRIATTAKTDYLEKIIPALESDACPGTMEDVRNHLRNIHGLSATTQDILEHVNLPKDQKEAR